MPPTFELSIGNVNSSECVHLHKFLMDKHEILNCHTVSLKNFLEKKNFPKCEQEVRIVCSQQQGVEYPRHLSQQYHE